MPSDLLINVRQISNYAARTASDGTETLLAQIGGLGGPYQSIRADTFVSTALGNASLGVGQGIPGGAHAGQVFADWVNVPRDGVLTWNAYAGPGWEFRYWNNGPAAFLQFDPAVGFRLSAAPAGAAGQSAVWGDLFTVSQAGAARLTLGTLTVARDPGAPLEVATSRWVTANTVASLNGRRGAVTLFHDDVTRALGMAPDDQVATTGSVQWAIGETLRTHPFVWAWNGRCGNVWFTEQDLNAVTMADGAAPLASLAPPGDSSARIANTAWVSRLLYGRYWAELAKTYAPIASPHFIGKPQAPEPPLSSNDGSLATTEWVRNMIQALAAGVVSFNGRAGFVTLSLADIEDIFTALGNHPLVNTPPVTASGDEIVNALWVNAAIQASRDTSVLSFNTRVGDVTLTLADVRAAEGQRRMFIGIDPPATPLASDMWMDSTDPTGGILYAYYVDGTPGQWVALSGGAAGPMGAQGNPGPPGPALTPKGTVPSVAALLALPGPHQSGDLWFVSATNESFAWDGSTSNWVSLGQIGAPFPDAPSDNRTYGRFNGAWRMLLDDGVY